MSAESSARSHAEEFRWWLGSPELSDDEAGLRDLLALRSAAEELIREQRDLLYRRGAVWQAAPNP